MSGTSAPVYTYSVHEVPLPTITMIRRSDGMVIPPDPSNANYVAWQAWAATATNKTADVPVPVGLMNSLALLATGLTVTSTGTPALNGTYRTDSVAMAGIQAEANALMLGGSTPVFADGSTSLSWADASGVTHTFTPAQFLELIHAVNYFVSQCAQYAAGVITTAPATTATIV